MFPECFFRYPVRKLLKGKIMLAKWFQCVPLDTCFEKHHGLRLQCKMIPVCVSEKAPTLMLLCLNCRGRLKLGSKIDPHSEVCVVSMNQYFQDHNTWTRGSISAPLEEEVLLLWHRRKHTAPPIMYSCPTNGTKSKQVSGLSDYPLTGNSNKLIKIHYKDSISQIQNVVHSIGWMICFLQQISGTFLNGWGTVIN